MNVMTHKPVAAVNWNRPDDEYSLQFWNQNVMQFWTDEEIPLSDDKMCWEQLSPDERDTYMKVLAGLTLLDTVQGGVGMPRILDHVDSLQRKAVLSFMSMMASSVFVSGEIVIGSGFMMSLTATSSVRSFPLIWP